MKKAKSHNHLYQKEKRPPLKTVFEGSNLREIQENTIFCLILSDFYRKWG